MNSSGAGMKFSHCKKTVLLCYLVKVNFVMSAMK